MKVIRQGVVLWAQFTQDALGVLIDVLEPDWGMPAAVETSPPVDHPPVVEHVQAANMASHDLAEAALAVVTEALGTARPGAW